MIDIVIIGGGNIGSRHLQGLQTLKLSANVAVVDPSDTSLSHAEERWHATGCRRHAVNYHTDISDLATAHADVAIIATTSKVRAAVTRKLLEVMSVDAIVFEKVLFPRLDEYATIADLLEAHAVDAWVNCARRAYAVYQDIHAMIGDAPVDIAVSGSGWNMASNAVHFLDLFALLTGSDSLRIDTGGLRRSTLDSRHTEYREVVGLLAAEDGVGNRCYLRCFKTGDAAPTVTIATPDGTWVIDESSGYLITAGEQFEPAVDAVTIPLQSELTGRIIDALLRTGTTPLTPYAASRIHHEALIEAFVGFFSEVRDAPVNTCPIT